MKPAGELAQFAAKIREELVFIRFKRVARLNPNFALTGARHSGSKLNVSQPSVSGSEQKLANGTINNGVIDGLSCGHTENRTPFGLPLLLK
jgi:hypothetical protein